MIRFEIPGDDPGRTYLDQFATRRTLSRRLPFDGPSNAPNLDPPGVPWVDGRDVVDDEGDSRMRLDVEELPRCRHVVARDLDRSEALVVAESNGADLRHAIRADRRWPPEKLRFEVSELGIGQHHATEGNT